MDQSLTAYALQLPDLTTLLNQMKRIDIDRLVAARKVLPPYYLLSIILIIVQRKINL
jgi:hypothetical protein